MIKEGTASRWTDAARRSAKASRPASSTLLMSPAFIRSQDVLYWIPVANGV